MSKTSRTYVSNNSMSQLMVDISDDNVYAREGNIVIGEDAASLDPTISKHNVIIGHNAGQSITDGDNNTYIGFGLGSSNESNKLRIGNRSFAGDDIIIGTFATTLSSQVLQFNASVQITNTTNATSKDTGSLVIEGGIGIEKNLYVGGNSDLTGTLRVRDTTDTSGYDSGSVIIAGGVGIAKNLNAKNVYQSRTGADALSTPYLLVPVGVIFPYSLTTAPSGYLMCDGSAVSRTTYSILFAVLSTTYGSGDGSTTFNLPDLTGKVIVGRDASDNDEDDPLDTIGATGGEKRHTLTTTEMPSHSHGVTDPGHTHTYYRNTNDQQTDNAFHTEVAADETDILGNTGSSTTGITIDNTGGGASHQNMQPYIVLTYIIKY